ncbi:MAG: TonB-dependent receptor [Steroidobacteraceae bacterium]
MKINSVVARAVRRAIVMSAVTAAGTTAPALAANEDSGPLETVVVTGSRIAQPNLTTTSPVTQVTDEDVKLQGVTRVEDLIAQLPQAFAMQNATVSNGATGTATVSLRNLQAKRTLVLVDGRRLPYGDSNDSAGDLNEIPTSMVERVEVLTGGASAVYGSDAVAGVVNFIMKKDFEGIEVSGQYGFYQHHNDYGGPGAVPLREVVASRGVSNPSQFQLPENNVNVGYSREGSLLVGVGTPDGRGNITAYATYRRNDPILQKDYDYSSCSVSDKTGSGVPTGSFLCGGSSTAYPGRYTDFATFDYSIDPATGDFRPWNSLRDQYNFGPLNYYQRPDTRYTVGAMGHFELGDHADVYTQLMYADNRTLAQIAPSGNFFVTGTISCSNPLLSASQVDGLCNVDLVPDIVDDPTTPENEVADFLAGLPAGFDGQGFINATLGAQTALTGARPVFNPDGSVSTVPYNGVSPAYIGRRNVEGGGRRYDFHSTSLRAVGGVRGGISESWNYDASVQFSRKTMDLYQTNDFSSRRLRNALDVVDVNGVPTCRSVVNGTDPSCVPYNIFAIGGVTAAALDYLQVPTLAQTIIDQNIVNATLTGDLGSYGMKLPAAAESIKVAIGAEYRRDKLQFAPDELIATGDPAGAGGAQPPVTGSVDVKELFMEGRIPLVQDHPGAQQLGIDVAYRYSDYGGGINTNTYKIGADWAPVQDVRFRASFQRAVRAANILELFTAQGFNLFDMAGDPCGPSPTASQAACLATGVPATQYGSDALTSPAGQYQLLQGGNADLVPEESDTLSFGIVFTPVFAPGLAASLDYYDIKIDKTITTFGPENTLNACYNNNDTEACSRIQRNQLGQLWVGTGHVEDLNINIGSLKTKGVDLQINYNGLSIGRMGKLNLSLQGTRTQELIAEPGPGVAPYDCVGYFSSSCANLTNGGPTPKWRHRARIGWNTPWSGIDLALSWRYIGSAKTFRNDPTIIDYEFPAFSYFDLSGSWTVSDKIDVRLGINNLLDKNPPVSANVGTTGNGNTYPQTYEALGRFIFTSATVRF